MEIRISEKDLRELLWVRDELDIQHGQTLDLNLMLMALLGAYLMGVNAGRVEGFNTHAREMEN